MLLPKSFTNKIVSKSEDCIKIRSNIRNMEDCNKWVREYGEVSNTQWNARTSTPNGLQMVCSKKFVCHQSSYNKVSPEVNKRKVSKDISCPAEIYIKVKLETTRTKQLDSFVKEGLPGIIIFKKEHNHGINTAESLRCLGDSTTRNTFYEYFTKGMTVAEANRYHKKVLQQKGYNEIEMANSRENPSNRRVHYWYEKWRISNTVPEKRIKLEEDIDQPTIQKNLQTQSKQELPCEHNQNTKNKQLQEKSIKDYKQNTKNKQLQEKSIKDYKQNTKNKQLQEESINTFSIECYENQSAEERRLRKDIDDPDPLMEKNLQTQSKQELPCDKYKQNTENKQLQEESKNKFSIECYENQYAQERHLQKELVKRFGDRLEKFNPSVQALEAALTYLETVTSRKECETMLHNLGNIGPLKRNSTPKIRIHNPRSVATYRTIRSK